MDLCRMLVVFSLLAVFDRHPVSGDSLPPDFQNKLSKTDPGCKSSVGYKDDVKVHFCFRQNPDIPPSKRIPLGIPSDVTIAQPEQMITKGTTTLEACRKLNKEFKLSGCCSPSVFDISRGKPVMKSSFFANVTIPSFQNACT
ncbi:hypothetical protein PGT21_011601 [Puccinia graminis f. sp. tritici]|uniref:Uncharacterized protein n=1 Tax=Puccinia graminis f. sp. tritici TaxID=56615 RepID=A0A5B0N3S2_PUCGR|nr:hypothetical protein PGTUg99_019670 [Puccinia graminis f. sp. tritici]KAA1083917.1 hypothetical protein PGT21_011601 [Puccinia graminis f. sp. tritici]